MAQLHDDIHFITPMKEVLTTDIRLDTELLSRLIISSVVLIEKRLVALSNQYIDISMEGGMEDATG